MSPEPSWPGAGEPCNDLTTTSPDADLAVTGQCASATVTSPEPEAIRAARPSTRATEMSPDPVEQSRSAAFPIVMSPEPLTIFDRPMSAVIEMSAEPALITNVRPAGTASRRWAEVLRNNWVGKLNRN